MAACAIVERKDIAISKTNLASKAIPRQWVAECKKFDNKKEFDRALLSAIQWLHRRADDELKVLIISTHGIPLTGTELDVGSGENVKLWDYRNHFAVLPPNLVIYVSACFGLFPSSEYLQSDGQNRPYVLGPLVDITFAHANQFQQQLLQLLMTGAELASSEALHELLSRFNNDKNLRDMHYGGRECLFAMWDKDGNFFPPESQGNQLAAPAKGKTTVIARKLLYTTEGKTPVACLFEDEHGHHLRATVNSFFEFSKNWEDLIGVRFGIVYQIINANEIRGKEEIDRIHVLKASPRKFNR
jgi:hypothetical protein